MRIALCAAALPLTLLLACAPAPAPHAPSASPAPAVATTTAATAAAVERARLMVTADDGFQLTMWRKAPAQPRRAVLLLHGRTWSGLPNFDLQVPGEAQSFMDTLVAQGYAAYALDLRGYGATPRDATGFLTPERAAADVAAALRAIGGHPVLFGWSMGSMVAQLASQRTPELMSALILFGAFDPDQRVPAHAEPAMPARRPNTAEAAAEDFRSPGAVTRRTIDAYVQAALAADPVRVDWRHDTEWNALAPEAVHVPVLLLQGELDPGSKTDGFARMFTRLGTFDRQWVVIPGGDHIAFLGNTAPRVMAAIRGFLERN